MSFHDQPAIWGRLPPTRSGSSRSSSKNEYIADDTCWSNFIQRNCIVEGKNKKIKLRGSRKSRKVFVPSSGIVDVAVVVRKKNASSSKKMSTSIPSIVSPTIENNSTVSKGTAKIASKKAVLRLPKMLNLAVLNPYYSDKSDGKGIKFMTNSSIPLCTISYDISLCIQSSDISSSISSVSSSSRLNERDE